ncbi:MAG: HigA family addiction module antitoxin [Treponema sp.]|nr:HigA family addiction module antitoxin [Treponema sp.]
MPNSTKTPGSVLQSFIDDYQINPFYLSKEIKLSYQTILNIIKGKAKISVPTALRLGKYFNNSPMYWLNIQLSSEIDELSANKKFLSLVKSIQKAEKPKGTAKAEVKTTKRKSNSISEKRKNASKVPGAKQARGRKSGKNRKK